MERKITNKLISDFEVYLIQEEKSPSTIEKYIRDIKAFFELSFGRKLTKEEELTIFAPFIKGDDARSSGAGAGLGLAISNLVVEKHGGRLYIDDNIEGYTKGFVINLKKSWYWKQKEYSTYVAHKKKSSLNFGHLQF